MSTPNDDSSEPNTNPDGPLELRRLVLDDAPWVQALFQSNARDNLTEEQRRRSGFVQGNLDTEMIKQRVDGPASVVALVGDTGVGVILSAEPDTFPKGPPALAVAAAREAGLEDFYLYGPGVVDENYRGRGILRTLKDESIRATAQSGKYLWAVGFVEHSNEASMAAHRKTGWRSVGSFTFKEREYEVIAHPVEPS
ncbi:GNAT family N-acetyltransferase [Corynebacterium sp.]|uniref:GNAT family N-acetyltransferase n=1 Tax=Corynebacterium sp. TaxID=1720 RepID=UPI0026DC5222|nr:hypothetical protein [Corynebacterium sp.]MDO5031924.1 hypothetical protein [Corynebacterium sp.]